MKGEDEALTPPILVPLVPLVRDGGLDMCAPSLELDSLRDDDDCGGAGCLLFCWCWC